ncbi:hypothetical protein D029_0049A, partial [Vibrio parahaemolyticus 970107]
MPIYSTAFELSIPSLLLINII